MKFRALTIDLTVEEIELSDQDLKDIASGDLGFLDLDCHHIFFDKEDWEKFKLQVNQLG